MTSPDDVSALPKAEFAFPGPIRDQLVGAILSGAKTSTTGLAVEFEAAGEKVPVVGERYAVVDSLGRPVAVIETTEVRLVTVADIDLAHAVDEGEGFETVAQWRATHEGFWHSPQMREALGDPEFTVTDTTPVVAERFRVVRVLPDPAGE